MRASPALRDVLAAVAWDQPGGFGEETSMLQRDLEAWFAPTRPRTVFKGPHDTTRVLLVEQDPVYRSTLRLVLTSPRIVLIEVTTGEAALDLLAMKRFDLVIIGGQHTMMSAEDTVRWIRSSLQLWADIAILVMLDQQAVHTAQRLISSGANDWARYPAQREELVAKLVALMPGLHDAGL